MTTSCGPGGSSPRLRSPQSRLLSCCSATPPLRPARPQSGRFGNGDGCAHARVFAGSAAGRKPRFARVLAGGKRATGLAIPEGARNGRPQGALAAGYDAEVTWQASINIAVLEQQP